MPRLIAFVIVCLLSAFPARADGIDDFINAQMKAQPIPGLSLAVIKDNQIIKSTGYGCANVELDVSAKPESVYKIGSMSKQFIATGIMLLTQEGKISLDDKASNFLEGTPNTWKDITIRHLLTHTSGLGDDAPGFDRLKEQSDADVIKSAYRLPLLFKPGANWHYSNCAYFILAEAIRKVTGKPWAEYLNERVFKPLEMRSTRTTSMTDLILNRASGYIWKDSGWQNADIMLALRPSGAFLSTVLDLAKWDLALYTDKILNSSLRTQIWTPVRLNDGTVYQYGFGWYLKPYGNHRRVYHEGHLPGFRSEIMRFPDDRITVIVLTNGDDAKVGSIALGVARMYLKP